MKLIELQMRNIFSYGNNITTIPLDIEKPTLIIGENHDSMVNGEFDANGTGKSAILNALLYVFFGRTGDDKHKVDGLINNINKKNLYASVTFMADNGVYYKIERWRKNKKLGGSGNNGVRITYGDSLDTIDPDKPFTPATRSIDQYISENILSMEFDIFARIATIIGSYEPFLNLPVTHVTKTSQTSILEELFGQRILTEKAVILKQKIKDTTAEIKTLTELNERIQSETARYNEQLELASDSIEDWDKAMAQTILDIKEDIARLELIDFDLEINKIERFNEISTKLDKVKSDRRIIDDKIKSNEVNERKFHEWNESRDHRLKTTRGTLSPLKSIDFDAEYNKLTTLDSKKRESALQVNLQAELKGKVNDLVGEIKKVDSELKVLLESKCPYCEQPYHDNETKIDEKREYLSGAADSYDNLHATLQDTTAKIIELESDIELIDCMFETTRDYDKVKSNYSNLLEREADIIAEVNPYSAIIIKPDDIKLLSDESNRLLEVETKFATELSSTTEVEYTMDKLYAEQARLKQLRTTLVDKIGEENPHTQTVERLNKVFDSIDALQIDEVDNLKVKLKHQDFLLKLLTKKDSFIRQALLDVNLPLLNTRLRYYLDAIGLFHNVMFTKEMTVSITQFGNPIDFSNLSTGQKARINLAIAFAFRDIVQERHQKINFCILDECLDHGLSNLGVKLAAKMIKKIAADNDLSMYIITHRDEIKSSFDATLKTILKGGLTTVEFS